MHESIIKTLAYSDIFDYPLTDREIYQYLVEVRVRDRVRVSEALSQLVSDSNVLRKKGKFFFLKGRKEIVALRKAREKWSKEKLTIAQNAMDKLKIIPTIRMMGITGALAVNNCKKNDDIDLIIITSENSLWLTRLLIIILCPMFGIRRRRPKDKEFNNKICFNLFLEENHLKTGPENLFLAHEICQIRPIFNKSSTYEKFLRENRWIKDFLPNAINNAKCKMPACKRLAMSGRQNAKPQFKIQNIFIGFLNRIVYAFQFWYMKPKMTVEKVSLHQAFFHPNNLSEQIIIEYNRKLALLGLDKKYN